MVTPCYVGSISASLSSWQLTSVYTLILYWAFLKRPYKFSKQWYCENKIQVKTKNTTQYTCICSSIQTYSTQFSVFMWRNLIPKLNITFPSEVLVLTDKRPYRNLTFHNVLAQQGSYCNRTRLNFQACVTWHENCNPRGLSRRPKDELSL